MLNCIVTAKLNLIFKKTNDSSATGEVFRRQFFTCTILVKQSLGIYAHGHCKVRTDTIMAASPFVAAKSLGGEERTLHQPDTTITVGWPGILYL